MRPPHIWEKFTPRVIFAQRVLYINQARRLAVRTGGTCVYFTECNTDNNGNYDAGSDCVLKRLTYDAFVKQKKPAGYIVKK